MHLTTKQRYDFFQVASTIQKSIRRGDEDTAMYFTVEMFLSGYDEYVWKRLKIMCSEDVGLADPMMPANIQALYEMYIAQKKKKDEKHRPERLFLTHAVLLLCRAQKSRLVDWTLINYWSTHEIEAKREIPDYAFDKHNQKGRSMGRGIDHFYAEGSLLENHLPLPGEEAMKKNAYNAEKAVTADLFE